jgi:cell wall-associated NlpC family hydrolase
VQEGDSLSNIAWSFDVDMRSIIAWNGLAEPYTLQPGQQLVIPGVTGDHRVAATQPAAEPADAPAPRPVVVVPTPRPVAVAPAPRPVAAAVAPARPAPAAAPSASSGSGWSIVGIASKYLGYAYVWGGTSPSTGFDCSGFVWYVYRASGNPVPRDMWGQLQSGTRVSRWNLQPGDIVFFANTYEYGLSHDGIYIGGGRFIHAADYGIGVEVSSLSDAYWVAHYFGATRAW